MQQIRSVKIGMPQFTRNNPQGWTLKAKQYFSYHGLSDDQRLINSSIHIDGLALSWYQWMHLNQNLTSWIAFKVDLLEHFGPSLYKDLLGELAKLQQTATVQDFYNQFEELSNQEAGVPATFLRSCFESRLRVDIRREVRAIQPTSLLLAFQLDKLMEDKNEATKAMTVKERYNSNVNVMENSS